MGFKRDTQAASSSARGMVAAVIARYASLAWSDVSDAFRLAATLVSRIDDLLAKEGTAGASADLHGLPPTRSPLDGILLLEPEVGLVAAGWVWEARGMSRAPLAPAASRASR